MQRQAARNFYWHGTASRYLKTILSQGLLPTSGQTQFKDEFKGIGRSIQTFGGVYLTDKFSTASGYAGGASRNTGSNPLYIATTYETRTPETLADEDTLLAFVERISELPTVNYLTTSGGGFWPTVLYEFKAGSYLPGGIRPLEYEKVAEIILGADVRPLLVKFWAALSERYPRAVYRLEKQNSELTVLAVELFRSFALHMLAGLFNDVKDKLVKEFQERRDNAPDYYQRYFPNKPEELQDALQQYALSIEAAKHPPAILKGTVQRLKAVTNAFSRKLQELSDPAEKAFHNNIRAQVPIGFSGKNRILLIVEKVTQESKLTGSKYLTDLIIHYGHQEVLPLFLTEYEKFEGGNYRLLTRNGRVMKMHLTDYDRRERGWPTDVWGAEPGSLSRVATRYLKNAAFYTEHEGEQFWGNAGAGLLLVHEGKMLLLKRSAHVEQPNTWGIPGGAAEMSNPTAADLWKTALEESHEEIGVKPSGTQILESKVFRKGNFSYTTFITAVSQKPPVRLNWESSDYGWFTYEEASQLQLHFGVRWLFANSSLRGDLKTASSGGWEILYHIGSRPAEPKPAAHGPWKRDWFDAPKETAVFLTSNPFTIAARHNVWGNVYAYKIHKGAIQKAQGLHRYDHGTEVVFSGEEWEEALGNKQIIFLGKKMDRQELESKIAELLAQHGLRGSQYTQKVRDQKTPFTSGKDLEQWAQKSVQDQDAVLNILSRKPQEAVPPLVKKHDPSTHRPLLSIGFPSEEHESIKTSFTRYGYVYTTRVDQEYGKYQLGGVYVTPWGQKVRVVHSHKLSALSKHPFYDKLTEEQITLLSKYSAFELLRLEPLELPVTKKRWPSW